MKRFFLFLAGALTIATAQAEGEDSLSLYHLQQIEIKGTRATKSTPVAYDNLSQEELTRNAYGTDMPSVLALTPSMIATNETGIGIGGTSMRLRGTDATRLNVTINGVSMNNPDSHAMYWYDTPDLISAVGSVQVQRGAGLSTNGTGAFGGSVSMTTAPLSSEFEGEASLSYGSYNTQKQAVGISSGLMGGHWAVDARLTHIGSDGYIDRGATDLKSYLLQGAYYNGNTVLKLLSFGGKAKTYLTYNGVTKEDMVLYGRRYHDSGQYYTSDGPFTLTDGSTVAYYDDQTDNYLQLNNQLLLSHRFNNHWSLSAVAFYTYGYGYYKQYKDDASLIEYGLTKDYEAEGDLIREKLMRNHLGGVQGVANYTSDRLDLSFGASWSYYTCPHWGELDWVEGVSNDKISNRWYDNDVEKHDGNLFARASWQAHDRLRLFADLQYRYVSYKAWGVNDNYDWTTEAMQPIDVDKEYHFFNPRVGLNWNASERSSFFLSAAIAQKEPTRGDFTDRYRFAEADSYPTSEKLYDLELGYTYTAPRLSLGINLYYMYYKDQLVKTGQINDSYDALNINVPDSYRRGVELSMAWRVASWLTASANATFSENKIKNYVDKVVDYALEGDVAGAYDYLVTEMGDTQISYSPNVMASWSLDLHHRGFAAVLTGRYVGEQYFTNFENDAMKLDSYCVSDLDLSYTFSTRRAKSVRIGATIYNLFNTSYESNGYGWSEAYEGERTDHAYYFPQAPLHVLANVTIKF